MTKLLDTFQARHDEQLSHLKKDQVDEIFLESIHVLITDLRDAGAFIASPMERGQIRTWLRFWAQVIYKQTGMNPDTTLLPLDTSRAHPVESTQERSSFSLLWMMVGGIIVAVIAIVLTALRQQYLSFASLDGQPHTPLLRVTDAGVGTGVGAGRRLEETAQTFCLGTPQLIANFALEGERMGSDLNWELERDGTPVAAQPAAPWGEDPQHVTIRVLNDGADGIEPGQYDLRLYQDDRVLAMQSFQVLAVPPRVFNLNVSDVPDPSPATNGPQPLRTGIRVVYLTYDYAGLCDGLDVRYTLHRDGTVVKEQTNTWTGAGQGQNSVTFQAPGDTPFPDGPYELVIAIGGEAQAEVQFTIGEPVVITEEPAQPAFGTITFAQGVEADGSPVLIAQEGRFGRDTVIVYAIFEYEDMREGTPWSAVWERGDDEVMRLESVWQATDREQGTYWISYQEDGDPLPYGDYRLTLSIDGRQQQEGAFQVSRR